MGSEEDRAGKMSDKTATDDNQPTHGDRAGLLGSGGDRLLSNGVSKGRAATLWLTKSPAGDEGIRRIETLKAGARQTEAAGCGFQQISCTIREAEVLPSPRLWDTQRSSKVPRDSLECKGDKCPQHRSCQHSALNVTLSLEPFELGLEGHPREYVL